PPSDTHPTSLHDALPISRRPHDVLNGACLSKVFQGGGDTVMDRPVAFEGWAILSEILGEHGAALAGLDLVFIPDATGRSMTVSPDRKSTRLNSSHSQISY